jgi:hypothetical protein
MCVENPERPAERPSADMVQESACADLLGNCCLIIWHDEHLEQQQAAVHRTMNHSAWGHKCVISSFGEIPAVNMVREPSCEDPFPGAHSAAACRCCKTLQPCSAAILMLSGSSINLDQQEAGFQLGDKLIGCSLRHWQYQVSLTLV